VALLIMVPHFDVISFFGVLMCSLSAPDQSLTLIGSLK